MKQQERLQRIVVAGPPGSGKSTLVKELGHRFIESAQIIPEVATLLITSLGITPDTKGGTFVPSKEFGSLLYRTQLIFEEIAETIAKNTGKTFMLQDKGRIDVVTHFQGDISEFETNCRAVFVNDCQRYDAVIYLELPSRDIYERIRGNNPCRFHDYEDAVRIATLARTVWGRHPQFFSVPSSAVWEEKVNRAVHIITLILQKKNS